MKTKNIQLGEGIYTASDAARILKIPFKKTKYWFSYYVKNKPDYQYHLPIKDTVAVNFLTLIEMYIFYELKKMNINSREINKAHLTLCKEFGTRYPFAQKDLYTAGNKILVKSLDEYVDAVTLNKTIPGFLDEFVKKIEFSNDKMAKKYYPLGKNKSVVINPENQFGQPIIEGTNILTITLYDYYKGGDSISSIAKLFDITQKNVKDAIEFQEAA